jgi:1-acyl-sn-glycerol-3-phosphate acyltransferase
MILPALAVNKTIKGLTRLLCRVDDSQLSRVPAQGPLIIVSNHINFLEVPLLYTHLLPRPMTGFAKAETWDNPAMGLLFDLWRIIPLRRGEADIAAFRKAREALKAGKILGVAPEGTRSGNGQLGRGHPGIVLIALQSGAPILPLVYWGNELLRNNLSRLRRTDFRISIGNPFMLDSRGEKVTRQVRQQMTDEIMYQLAALLPPEYRGAYSDLEKAKATYLKFIPDSSIYLPKPF